VTLIQLADVGQLAIPAISCDTAEAPTPTVSRVTPAARARLAAASVADVSVDGRLVTTTPIQSTPRRPRDTNSSRIDVRAADVFVKPPLYSNHIPHHHQHHCHQVHRRVTYKESQAAADVFVEP